MTSVYDYLAGARDALVRAGLAPADAAFDAEVLARHALGWDRARLVVDGRSAAPPGFGDRFHDLIARRSRREPVAFIVGHREFWGLDFEVSPDVLIPRPETEMIVEAACARRPERSDVRRIIDVGTGSGCLAVTLAREFPAARVVATDISPAALAVAQRNAARYARDRVTFVRTDLLDAVAGPVDLIVSNPPYVPSGAALSHDVVRFEPATALYGGVDGLALLRRLIASARTRVADGGLFIVEFGYGQDDAVGDLAAAAGWRDVQFEHDLQSIPRIAVLS
jgi:release factor glutamine methyltransferase